MSVSEQQLIEQGAKLITARRHLWDLERRLGLRSWDSFLKHEVTLARREYTRLLRERKDLQVKAQGNFFDAL